jgi:homogentisate phytyltransferase / homogentisate geranylgeranyltransferase
MMRNWISILWKFGRPHTILGSFVSVTSIFLLVNAKQIGEADWFLHWLPAIVVALLCNLFITGLNQNTDIEVDMKNKPWLPIPAGLITKKEAFIIVTIAGIASLVIAYLFSFALFVLIIAIMLLGIAYSVEPIRLKRHHVYAALAIVAVRGILINAGFYSVFKELNDNVGLLDPIVWPITAFVVFFSLGIAWFKDLPDVAGDKEFNFNTLAVTSGKTSAFRFGVVAVILAYASVIISALLGYLPNPNFYVLTHIIGLGIFLFACARLDINHDQQIKSFYMLFWVLFFADYVVYTVGVFIDI